MDNQDDILAPFNKEQIEKIKAFQNCGWLHPLTCCGEGECLRNNNDGILIPDEEGLTCPCGEYGQNYVPAFVLSDLPEEPFKDLNIPEDGEA